MQEAAIKVAKESERMLDGYMKEIREADAKEQGRFKDAVAETRAAFEEEDDSILRRVAGDGARRGRSLWW